MTVEQLLNSMGARELQEWQIFLRIEQESSKETESRKDLADRAEQNRRQATG